MRMEKLDVALDVCAQHSGGTVLGENSGQHHGGCFLDHSVNDLLHQFAFAVEVIGNHALADARAFRDLSQRSVCVSESGYRVDSALDYLRAARIFDERALFLTGWDN